MLIYIRGKNLEHFTSSLIRNMDPYEILELPRNFTIEQLRANYKRIALKTHPDTSGLKSDYLFKLVTNAYRVLLEEHKGRQQDKQFNDLRTQSQGSIKQQSRDNRQGIHVNTGTSFNIERFNQVFEEVKLDDVHDSGYGTWMAKSSSDREDIKPRNVMGSGKFDMNRFNQAFEAQPMSTFKKVIKYKEPEPVCSTQKIGFSEIGLTNVSDFSGENTSRKNLNYTDYKVAHTTNKLVDPRALKNKKEYRTIHELEADRSSLNYQMSNKDMQELAKRKAREEEKEKKRLQAIAQRDDLIQRQYEQLNRLLLKEKF
jgi:curved DNA-binding protein CbpA